MSAGDEHDEASRLVAELGACYARARRYRALAAESERHLERALALGSELRRYARAGAAGLAGERAAVRELAALVRECGAALARLRASAEYAAATRAWDEGRLAAVAALAPAIFDAVVPDPTRGPLFVPVPVTSARGGGEHFLPPPRLAERILEIVAAGIPAAHPTPELGADERIGAVFLEDRAETVESPVMLALAPEQIALPRFRLEPAGEVLVYAPRLQARPTIRLAATATDEWWAVLPDGYAGYAVAVTRELAARGLTDVGTA